MMCGLQLKTHPHCTCIIIVTNDIYLGPLISMEQYNHVLMIEASNNRSALAFSSVAVHLDWIFGTKWVITATCADKALHWVCML